MVTNSLVLIKSRLCYITVSLRRCSLDIFIAVYFIVVSGIFGVVIGSFLNVVIYRLPAGRTIVKGHSMCMTCGHNLAAKDLIPIISWASLHGKCRYCGAPIASRYTKIESFTGVSFLLASIAVFKYAAPAVINIGYNFGTFLLLYFVAYVLALSSAISAMMIYYDTGKGYAGTAVWSGICGFLCVLLPHLFTSTITGTDEGFSLTGTLCDTGFALIKIIALVVLTFILFIIFRHKYTLSDMFLDISLGVIPLFGYFYMFADKWIDYGVFALFYAIARAALKKSKADKYAGIIVVCTLQAVSVIHYIYMFVI